eukprot:PhF_6_TR42112/c0_g1_i11/m.63592
MFPNDAVGYQNIRLWYLNHVDTGKKALDVLKGKESNWPVFLGFIMDILTEMNTYGLPISYASLHALVNEKLEEENKVTASLKAHVGDWRPSYTTLRRWLKDAKVTLKSAKNTYERTYPPNWKELGHDMLLRISYIAQTERVIPECIVNADETAAAYYALAEKGLAEQGCRPQNISRGDKRSATLLSAISLTGDLLEPFVIWNGKEGGERAKVKEAFHVKQFQTTNHYVSTAVLETYANSVLKPYREQMIQRNPQADSKSPLIWLIDCCSVHVSEETCTRILRKCHGLDEDYWWLRIVFVPAHCTGKLQPCDVGLFNRLKRKLIWTRSKILLNLLREKHSKQEKIGDTKSLGAALSKGLLIQAILDAYNVIGEQREANVAAFEKCGLTKDAIWSATNLAEAARQGHRLFPNSPVFEADDDDEEDPDDMVHEDDDNAGLLVPPKRGREGEITIE